MEKLSNLPLFAGWKKQGASTCWSAFTPARDPSGLGRPPTPMGAAAAGCWASSNRAARPGENRRGRRQDRAGRLGPGGVFGELIAFASLPCDSVTVVCEADCVIVFLPQAQLASCGKSCACHRQLLENLLSLISQKAFALSERVEVLSCRSTREKLLCYFRIRAGEEKSLSFSLPFTLSAWQSICAWTAAP